MKVSAKIELPQEITKDAVVKELLAQKHQLEGKIGRLEQKVSRLQSNAGDDKSLIEKAREFMDKMQVLANEYLEDLHDGCQ